jgi:hypothetical protein
MCACAAGVGVVWKGVYCVIGCGEECGCMDGSCCGVKWCVLCGRMLIWGGRTCALWVGVGMERKVCSVDGC